MSQRYLKKCFNQLNQIRKLHLLNAQINQMSLVPNQTISEDNYQIQMMQDLHIYNQNLLNFAHSLCSRLTPYHLGATNIINLQLFQGFIDSNVNTNQVQIQYKIVPNTTLVCWVPLDHQTYTFSTIKLSMQTCPPKRYSQEFIVKHGVSGLFMKLTQSTTTNNEIQLKSGNILIQSQSSGPNQLTCQIQSPTNRKYRMLAISYQLEGIPLILSKL